MNSRVSTGHNGDGQRADFSGFPARSNAMADVGLHPFPRIQPPPGGQSLAGHGPDAASRVTDCHVASARAASGPSLSPDRDNEAFLKIARAM